MKEQSHKDEMASLLKADFDRLRARGVATTLAPAEPPTMLEPGSFTPDPGPVEEPAAAGESEPPAVEDATVESGGGWLRRLLGSP
jgi:hypothetical protein